MRVEDFIIEEGATVLSALKQLDETGQRILFLAPGGKLTAVLTDGDVRKFMLRGGDLSDAVANAANYTPKSLPLSARAKAKAEMQRLSIVALPLLDTEGHLADIAFANDYDVHISKKVCQPVVIMAGGLGTRLYPYTKILPKPLIPVGEQPIVEHIMQRFADFGCKEFNLIVNYKKGMIKSYFADAEHPYTVDFTDEDKPLGTGGGLSLLKGRMTQAFFLTNCDTLIDADYGDIFKTHKAQGNLITMVCALKNIQIPYGVVKLGDDGGIQEIVEKPENSYLINTGMYIVEPRVVEDLPSDTPLPFTDIFKKYHDEGHKVGVYPVSENSWMDMGQLEELDDMRRRLEGGK